MYAVLIPLVRTESGDALLMEVRSEKVRQPGEVCFPGGRSECGETAIGTAAAAEVDGDNRGQHMPHWKRCRMKQDTLLW